MAATQRDLDLVLFGASGFTGRLVAGYLAQRAPAHVRIALAGRSTEAVRAVRDPLGGSAASWPVVSADSTDPTSLAALASSAAVVVSTVGPYAEYGLPLVEACARTGTHYADLTGEVLFIRDSIDRYQEVARETGARIVHCCGFDSIPSDLGVWDLARAAAAAGEGTLGRTTLAVTSMRGGVSGGTLASARSELTAVRADPGRRAIVTDPYSLSPDRAAEPDLGREGDLRGVELDADLGQWVGPFVMAGINTRVVRRSNALLGYRYGRTFAYREVMAYGRGADGAAKAGAMAAGQGGLSALLGDGDTGPAADAAATRVLPKPGEGPSEQARREGYFTLEIHTETTTGARFVEKVSAQGDPGYAATSVMLGQAGLCLAEDGAELTSSGGILTPAVAFGSVLVERLRASGMVFDTVPRES